MEMKQDLRVLAALAGVAGGCNVGGWLGICAKAGRNPADVSFRQPGEFIAA